MLPSTLLWAFRIKLRRTFGVLAKYAELVGAASEGAVTA